MDYELGGEEARIIAEYSERYRPQPYRQVFFPPPSKDWLVEGLYGDSFFESAKLLLNGIVAGQLAEPFYGVTALYLCRHYVELAIKYTLFHSRWLKDESTNAADEDILPVAKGHNLQAQWDTLMREVKTRVPSILDTGLDLKFVAEFVAEFHKVDDHGCRFRYPRERIAVSSSHATADTLGINFRSLLFDLQHAHDVLDALDSHLIEQHGQNEEWEAEVRSW